MSKSSQNVFKGWDDVNIILVEETLSDGSTVFNIVIKDRLPSVNQSRFEISCTNDKAAVELFNILCDSDYICGIS